MSGGMDGQTLFHGILPATARGLASKTAINWDLKVKDIEYDVGLTKNYCITVSIQKISSIHKFIQQILGSHEPNDHTHFWPRPLPQKNHWNNFLLSWICTNFRVLWPDWPHLFLAKHIWKFYDQLLIYVNLCQHAKNHASSLICSGDMVD